MIETDTGLSGFDARFATRQQAERYRDRYKTGRRARTHRREQVALRDVLRGVGRIAVALDLPCGTGRLAPILADVATKVILVDSSTAMLAIAREECAHLVADLLQADARQIGLPDRSVDLVFSHRFLAHLFDAETRAQVLAELVRVTRRYLILSYYPPGIRNRCRWWIRKRLRRSQPGDPLLTATQFLNEASTSGLRLVRRRMVRRLPLPAALYLFERT